MSTKLIAYQIRVQGHMTLLLSELFAPLTVSNEPNGEALLQGALRDQAELLALLLKLHSLNFTLVALHRAEPEGHVAFLSTKALSTHQPSNNQPLNSTLDGRQPPWLTAIVVP
ncbi:MAG: hypothetical protein KDE58_14330 [Caldilineaceae bacterium]|nr:hypothetical protein [Caldilineaceae bacterium]